MFEKITPEQARISSKNVIKFIKALEKRGATTHGVLFMKGDKVFYRSVLETFSSRFLP